MNAQSSEIEKARMSENWGEVINLLERARKGRELTKDELILLGRAILLGDDECRFSLSDAKNAFQLALEEDEEFVDALMELGWFYYSVDERLSLAEKFFQKAVEILESDLLEAKRALSDCRSELKEL